MEGFARPQNVAILGLGRIAHSMAQTLVCMARDDRYKDAVRPYAVATRQDPGRARDFAALYGFPKAYGSYGELLADPDVDIVYIATPHALHMDQAIACMRAGKAVLVEKAFTANAEQAERVLEASRQTGQACVEAIWTRFMPSRQRLADIVSSGVIGAVTEISASLSYPTSHKKRIMDPAMAGGALLDVGVYDLNFIEMALPQAHVDRISTVATMTRTGVDKQFDATLWLTDPAAWDRSNDGQVLAQTSASILSVGDRLGLIRGTKGYMVVHNINNPESVDIHDARHALVRSIRLDEGQLTGYEYEVLAAARARVDGRLQAPEMPHEETLRIMRQMDEMRRQWGEVYPFERQAGAGQR